MTPSEVFTAEYPLHNDLDMFLGASSTPISGVTNLAQAVKWFETGAAADTTYRLVLYADANSSTIELVENTFNLKSNITISLEGAGGERTIQLTGTGQLFDIQASFTLILNDNINLRGLSSNWRSLVGVAGTFTMNGGTIGGNTATFGGGVQVTPIGTFTKTGGTIYGNDGTANANCATNMVGGTPDGHAVCVDKHTDSPPRDYDRNATAGPSVNLSTANLSSANWDFVH
jgi:hypothetical protein